MNAALQSSAFPNSAPSQPPCQRKPTTVEIDHVLFCEPSLDSLPPEKVRRGGPGVALNWRAGAVRNENCGAGRRSAPAAKSGPGQPARRPRDS